MMDNLNIRTKILLVFLSVTAVLFLIVSYVTNTYFIAAILYSICALIFIILIAIINIKLSKFFSLIEKENSKIEEEFKQKDLKDGKIVNLSYKEYNHLIKKGFVPIGKDKTEIIELKKD